MVMAAGQIWTKDEKGETIPYEPPTYLHFIDALNKCTSAIEETAGMLEKAIESQAEMVESVAQLASILEKLGKL